jgi:hypothetical protein
LRMVLFVRRLMSNASKPGEELTTTAILN